MRRNQRRLIDFQSQAEKTQNGLGKANFDLIYGVTDR